MIREFLLDNCTVFLYHGNYPTVTPHYISLHSHRHVLCSGARDISFRCVYLQLIDLYITRWPINWKRQESSGHAARIPVRAVPLLFLTRSVLTNLLRGKSGLFKFGHGQLSDIGSSTQRSNISICLELLITQQQLSSTKKTSLRCRERTGR